MPLATSLRPAQNRDVLAGAGLLALAGVGWWWSTHTMSGMSMTATRPSMGGSAGSMSHAMPSMGVSVSSTSAPAFLLVWVAMMAAMMFPAIIPVVRLYSRAAERGGAVPTPLFVAGYLLMWSAIGVPAYFAWRALQQPVAEHRTWVAYFAGSVLLAAAAYQVSPLKYACLKRCRSPLSFFLSQASNLRRPVGAVRAGAQHGLICIGCCWAIMAVLVALGTMNLGWMLALSVLIFLEKATRVGQVAPVLSTLVFAGLGVGLLMHPHFINSIT